MDGKKKFLKELKSNFIVFGQAEKSYIKQLESQIDNHFSYEQIKELYGDPNDLAASFLDECTPVIIEKNIKKKKIILGITIILLILVLFFTIYTLYIFRNAEDSFVDREVVIIEEE